MTIQLQVQFVLRTSVSLSRPGITAMHLLSIQTVTSSQRPTQWSRNSKGEGTLGKRARLLINVYLVLQPQEPERRLMSKQATSCLDISCMRLLQVVRQIFDPEVLTPSVSRLGTIIRIEDSP